MFVKRNKIKNTEVDTEGSWAISYGDMITLLLTFFILFFSLDKNKSKAESMNKALIEVFEKEKIKSEMAQDLNKASEIQKLDLLNAQIIKLENHIVVTFPGISFFDLGRTELTEVGKEELKKFLNKFIPYAAQYIVKVQAYTDTKKVIPTKSRKFSDNLELSALRAVSSIRYLQATGLPLNRMRIGGFGEINLTKNDLEILKKSKEINYDKNGIPLARKVVLIIEPDIKDKI